MPFQYIYSMGFPGGSEGKVSACNVGDPSSIPSSEKSPGQGNSNPLPGKSHRRRSLVGYSPCGPKDLDMTERLHFYFPFHPLDSP